MAYFEKDYIKRQIQQLMSVLSRVLLQAKAEGRYETGLEAIRKTCGEALGLDAAIVERMTASSLAQVLNDDERLRACAWLEEQEAELRELGGDPEAARDLRRRALEVTLELVHRLPGDHDARAAALRLADTLDPLALGEPYRTWLESFKPPRAPMA